MDIHQCWKANVTTREKKFYPYGGGSPRGLDQAYVKVTGN